MTSKALFVVRAEVRDAADRDAFDRWYREEHLPDAVKAFGARRGWRGWSRSEEGVHYAFYEFDSHERLQASTRPETLQTLIAEFDRCWGDRVTRSRDVIEVVGDLEGETS